MDITISADEIINQMKDEISNLYHLLMVEKITTKKLAEKIEKYESAECNFDHHPLAATPDTSTALRRLSAARETLPVPELPEKLHSSP